VAKIVKVSFRKIVETNILKPRLFLDNKLSAHSCRQHTIVYYE